MASNLPPGVTGGEPQIVGYPDEDDYQEDCLRLTRPESGELEQLLLYTVYPEAYDETPINESIILDILNKVEDTYNGR